jgi:hypothetical protein
MPDQSKLGDGPDDTGVALSAHPSTLDQVMHDVSNIVTTVDNYGFIGGYGYYGIPSGEWPRNSGHNYLADIRFWMGGVTAAGDTLVANSLDDFQAMLQPVNGEDAYRMYLSTDSTRYHDYDATDTMGLSLGSPANGWRVWDSEKATWGYNETYDPLLASTRETGPTSLQESHYRFNDAALGEPLMGLELTQTILSWNYCYNENFLFVVLDITNTSPEDYSDFAFGLYIDLDVGGPDGTGENGRLGDLVAYDEDENLAWIYDEDAEDPGWGRNVTTGVMGTKYLETPDDIGMTAFRSDDWVMVDGIGDKAKYALINSSQFDESLPPTDQFYLQCTRGIDLTAGKTVRVVFALVAGADEDDFRDNATMAQQLYDSYYVGPQPPTTPTLSARAGDGKVYLHWNNAAEVSLDPLTGEADFVGYKLYRSENRGKTWGDIFYNTGNDCMDSDYPTLATYSIAAFGDRIQHSFVDSLGLHNGVEYWYCLAAYDAGDEVAGVDALQTGFGVANQASNVVAIAPESNPAGFYEAAATTEHLFTGSGLMSEGEVAPIVFDQSELTGSSYSVVFEDAIDASYWHLINTTTDDTLLANQTRAGGDPALFDVTEGLRVHVTNGDRIPRSYGQTAGADTNLVIADFWGPTLPALTGNPADVFSDEPFRDSYELRYTGDSTRAVSSIEYWGYDVGVAYWVPFEAWNTTTNTRVSLCVYDYESNGTWESYDDLGIVNYPYDPDQDLTALAFPLYYSWLFTLDYAVYDPSVGDILSVVGAPMNGPGDSFTFKVDGVNSAEARDELADVKVVPNPYFARYDSRIEVGEGESVLKFIRIPGKCFIRIYTLAGDLVHTIDHKDGSGEAEWNLQSSNQQQVASGTYLYHIESGYGERIGRFAVIK